MMCPPDTHQVELPYPVMLRDGKGRHGAVERPPRLRHQLLLHQELEVLEPDAGHLVHRDQRALVRVVHRDDSGAVKALPADRQPSLQQVCVPQLRIISSCGCRHVGGIHIPIPEPHGSG